MFHISDYLRFQLARSINRDWMFVLRSTMVERLQPIPEMVSISRWRRRSDKANTSTSARPVASTTKPVQPQTPKITRCQKVLSKAAQPFVVHVHLPC